MRPPRAQLAHTNATMTRAFDVRPTPAIGGSVEEVIGARSLRVGIARVRWRRPSREPARSRDTGQYVGHGQNGRSGSATKHARGSKIISSRRTTRSRSSRHVRHANLAIRSVGCQIAKHSRNKTARTAEKTINRSKKKRQMRNVDETNPTYFRQHLRCGVPSRKARAVHCAGLAKNERRKNHELRKRGS
jgi:hypothetical protein